MPSSPIELVQEEDGTSNILSEEGDELIAEEEEFETPIVVNVDLRIS